MAAGHDDRPPGSEKKPKKFEKMLGVAAFVPYIPLAEGFFQAHLNYSLSGG